MGSQRAGKCVVSESLCTPQHARHVAVMMMAMRVGCGGGNHRSLKVNETRGAVNQPVPIRRFQSKPEYSGRQQKGKMGGSNLATRFALGPYLSAGYLRNCRQVISCCSSWTLSSRPLCRICRLAESRREPLLPRSHCSWDRGRRCKGR